MADLSEQRIDEHDCLVVGGGPAGLTAAIYLARFHLSVMLIDSGKSRALWIAQTHNHAGFPSGISGQDLLDRMRHQARQFGVDLRKGQVRGLRQAESAFEVSWCEGLTRARSVLIATGTCNRQPQIEEALHSQALALGLLRYCPVCDGYEVTDKSIGVIGTGQRGFAEAKFLRSFSETISLIAPSGEHSLSPKLIEEADVLGIERINGPARIDRFAGDTIVVTTPGGDHEFDTVYPALGSDCQAELAVQLGAALSADGDVLVDQHQRTTVPCLYAAGDVVSGLDQISHAMGQAGVAATAIRNDLASLRPLVRAG